MAPRDPSAAVPLSVLDDVPYVELHLHSNYSLLEGASSIDDLLVAAKEQGHRALALTDHDGMYGSMEFARSAKGVGLRPITGLEVTLAEEDGTRHHVTLLAERREGYANLCRIARGVRPPRGGAEGATRAALDPVLPVAFLEQHTDGYGSVTGCREGLVTRLAHAGHAEEAERILERWVRWSAEGRCSSNAGQPRFGDRPRNRALVLGGGALVCGSGRGMCTTTSQTATACRTCWSRSARKTLDESHRERRPTASFYCRRPRIRRASSRRTTRRRRELRPHRPRCTFDLTHNLGTASRNRR